MNRRSFHSGACHSHVSRRAALELVGMVSLGWSTPAFCDESHHAAEKGDLKRVQALLKHQPDLLFSKDGQLSLTPLHNAAFRGNRPVAEMLLANGADVNAKSSTGVTPLHLAAYGGRKDVAEVLLAHHADVNAKDAKGLTPLQVATAKGQMAIVELLRH